MKNRVTRSVWTEVTQPVSGWAGWGTWFSSLPPPAVSSLYSWRRPTMSPLFDPPFLGEPLCICPLHAVFVVPTLLSLGPSLHQLVSSVGEGWVVSLFLVLTSPRLPFLSRAKLSTSVSRLSRIWPLWCFHHFCSCSLHRPLLFPGGSSVLVAHYNHGGPSRWSSEITAWTGPCQAPHITTTGFCSVFPPVLFPSSF